MYKLYGSTPQGRYLLEELLERARLVINSDAITPQLCMLNYLEGKSERSVLYGLYGQTDVSMEKNNPKVCICCVYPK